MKTSELIGPALDWAVEFIEGGCKAEPRANYWLERWIDPERRYLCESASTNWAQGGPIIEREEICIQRRPGRSDGWGAHYSKKSEGQHFYSVGPTPLIAAMRAFVASKLGDEVEIPSELLP